MNGRHDSIQTDVITSEQKHHVIWQPDLPDTNVENEKEYLGYECCGMTQDIYYVLPNSVVDHVLRQHQCHTPIMSH